MPIVMLWVYIFANIWKLVFTKFDSAQLFIYHNQYWLRLPAAPLGRRTTDSRRR